MIDEQVLENIYQESLEEDIIHYLAEEKKLSLEDAMDAYYNSRLSEKIHAGKFGVQYLDYRNLVRILIESESELFE